MGNAYHPFPSSQRLLLNPLTPKWRTLVSLILVAYATLTVGLTFAATCADSVSPEGSDEALEVLAQVDHEVTAFQATAIQHTMMDTSLTNQTRQARLAELQTATDLLRALIEELFLAASERTIQTEMQDLRTQFEKVKLRFASSPLRAAPSRAQDPAQQPQPPTFATIIATPGLLTPNVVYIVSHEPNARLKTVEFSSEVTEYIAEAQHVRAEKFLRAIQNGLVGASGQSGVKVMSELGLIEVKAIGQSINDRLIGCYKSGRLRVLRVAAKTPTGRIPAERFRNLCPH